MLLSLSVCLFSHSTYSHLHLSVQCCFLCLFVCFLVVPIHCLTMLLVRFRPRLASAQRQSVTTQTWRVLQSTPPWVCSARSLPSRMQTSSQLPLSVHTPNIHMYIWCIHVCACIVFFRFVSCAADVLSSLAALHVGHEPSSIKKLIALFKTHYISQVGLVVEAPYCGDCMKAGFFSLTVCVPGVCRHSGTGCHRESCVFCERFCWRHSGLVLRAC